MAHFVALLPMDLQRELRHYLNHANERHCLAQWRAETGRWDCQRCPSWHRCQYHCWYCHTEYVREPDWSRLRCHVCRDVFAMYCM